jgi:glycosyltransferase involved in cell wall biosynthesis
MVAYHFPPLAGSSGIQRTLRFVQQLPSFGWQPLVLSAHPRAYERTSADLESEIPQGTVVRRAFALDTARHLALGERYAGFMARPDRWISWKFDGVRQGMRLIREYKPRAIWSTYPIATAHLIGAQLQRLSGVPWVADFRDPMAQDGYPPDPLTHRRFEDIEQLAIRHAASCTFAAPGAARLYRERYPSAADRIVVLENGYDEESFLAAEEANRSGDDGPLNPGAITLLHSGLVYPVERNPAPLFEALASLEGQGLKAERLKVRFRAAVHDDLLRQLAKANGVEGFVEMLPPIGYQAALQEMMRADALLVMQGADCNEQIPAKIYEYLRARRPILCLADPAGDTAGLLRRAGLEDTAPLESAHEIAALVSRFVGARSSGALGDRRPSEEFVQCASRRRRTEALAQIFDRLPPRAWSGALADAPLS